MPIIIDDLTTFTPMARTFTPKFFSKDVLTGSGKTTGLLNQHLRPGRYPSGQNASTMAGMDLDAKLKVSGDSRTTHTIPTAVLTRRSMLTAMGNGMAPGVDLPAAEDCFEITSHATTLAYDAHLVMHPQGLIVVKEGEEDTSKASGRSITTTTNVLYRMEVHVVPTGTRPARVPVWTGSYGPTQVPAEGYAVLSWSFAPLDDAEALIAHATAGVSKQGTGTWVDVDALAEWMAEYDLYERVCDQAERWSSMGVADEVCAHIAEIFAGTPNDVVLNALATQLRYLETYPVPLEAYRAIHAGLLAHAPSDIVSVLVKQNVNLLMNHTLQELEDIKDQLPVPVDTTGAASLDPKFSTQQRTAITAPEALIQIQAGAGTGKSTTILARIKHLIEDCGVDPAELTVLSFTNAAADNISEKNPEIGSMTIARMIHDIYSLNFPAHDLSNIETIVNSLASMYKHDPLSQTFQRRLVDTDPKRKVPGATTALNAFVEHYRDQVLAMLSGIGQTCLELEIILAYQLIDTMAEPPHVSAKYLIVDEVQDCSIFEFIYILKYAAKHKANLFMVGDASQTLYEFRAANPKALNALEGSGVFACHQLTTNYRSNQAVLDFANVNLQNIEANQIAQIQLRANALTPPTAKEFTEKVTLDYRWYKKLGDFREDLASYVRNVLKPWIDERLARDEQIAFLAFARAEVGIIKRELEAVYPGQTVVDLTSERGHSTTVFSEFIKKHWEEVEQVPDLSNASFAVTQGIFNNLHTLVRGDHKKAEPVIRRMVSEWWVENSASINSWVRATKTVDARTGKPLMEAGEFFEHLRKCLLSFEISRNAVRQSLLNRNKAQQKKEQLAAGAKLVVSTIHGAKGLEFDHVVGLYKYESQMDESDKRMYYVMLTRAMQSEYVLAYGGIKKPKVEMDYTMIVNALTQREQIAALQAQGYDPAILSEDETEAALAMLAKQADDLRAAGDDEAADTLYPCAVDYTTSGAALPPKDEPAQGADGSEDDSASPFASAKA